MMVYIIPTNQVGVKFVWQISHPLQMLQVWVVILLPPYSLRSEGDNTHKHLPNQISIKPTEQARLGKCS